MGNKEGITIITSAYKSGEFFKEYIESIQGQTYFKDHDNYEILYGIDNCNETAEQVLRIAQNYKNIRIFFFPEHVGTYTIRNTLVDYAQYDYLVFFDSDDIMKPNFISETIKVRTKDNIIRYYFENFYQGGQELNPASYRFASHGVHACYKDLLFEYGGYMDWFNSADTELKNRMAKYGIPLVVIEEDLFLRRRHKNSLCTMLQDWKQRDKRIQSVKENPKQIERLTGKCREIALDIPPYAFYIIKKDYLNITWFIDRRCNLQCSYCKTHTTEQDSFFADYSPEEINEMFRTIHDRTEKKLNIQITGGEPFMFPKFIEIVSLLSEYSKLTIQTNLTLSNVPEISKVKNPKNIIQIEGTYHEQAIGTDKAMFETLVRNVNTLTDNGFYVVLNYLAFPKDWGNLSDKIKGLKTLMPKAVITALPIRTADYPRAYTQEQRDCLYSAIKSQKQARIDSAENNKIFKGVDCGAGESFLVISNKGEIYPCTSAMHSEKMYMANITKLDGFFLKRIGKCPFETCACVYQGLYHSTKNKKVSYNRYFEEELWHS